MEKEGKTEPDTEKKIAREIEGVKKEEQKKTATETENRKKTERETEKQRERENRKEKRNREDSLPASSRSRSLQFRSLCRVSKKYLGAFRPPPRALPSHRVASSLFFSPLTSRATPSPASRLLFTPSVFPSQPRQRRRAFPR